jgi:hypothetical protein
MVRRLGLMAFSAMLVVMPAAAQAQRGRYGNIAPMTPYGPAYDPVLWRQAGYNPAVYDQLLQQKMLLMQQRAVLKQQKQMQLMQKAQKKAGQTGPGSFAASQAQQQFNTPLRSARKKKGNKTIQASEPQEQTEAKTNTAADTKAKNSSRPSTSASATPTTTTSLGTSGSTTGNPPASSTATTDPSAKPGG